MIRDSREVVAEAKIKHGDVSEFVIDFSHLDRKLEDMLYIEKKISWTNKTIKKNKLIKQLKAMHNNTSFYVYQSNKHRLFEYMVKKMDETIAERTKDSLAEWLMS